MVKETPDSVYLLPTPLQHTGAVGIIGLFTILKETGSQYTPLSFLRAEMIESAADLLSIRIHFPFTVKVIAFPFNSLPTRSQTGIVSEIIGISLHHIPKTPGILRRNLLTIGIGCRCRIHIEIMPDIRSIFIQDSLPSILA